MFEVSDVAWVIYSFSVFTYIILFSLVLAIPSIRAKFVYKTIDNFYNKKGSIRLTESEMESKHKLIITITYIISLVPVLNTVGCYYFFKQLFLKG